MTDYSNTAAFPSISSIAYDDALGILCVTGDAGEFWTWNVFTNAKASVPVNGAYMLDAAVTADGRYALFPNLAAIGADQVARVDLTTNSLAPFTGVSWNSSQTFAIATTQSGLSVAILAQGTAVVLFDPNAAILNNSGPPLIAQPPPTFGTDNFPQPLITLPPVDYSENYALAAGRYGLVFYPALATSEHHRYVLIQAEQNLTPFVNAATGIVTTPVATQPAALYLYDSASGQVVAQNTAAFADQYSNIRLDQAAGDDVSEAAGLVEAASGGAIHLFDLGLHPIGTLAPAGRNFLTVHFAAGGHQLFAWDEQNNDIVVFDTSSWSQVGVIHAGAASDGQRAETIFGNLGQMTTSGDGRMLFIQEWSSNQAVVQAIDLSGRMSLTITGDPTHSVLYGGPGPDTITGGSENDFITGGGGADTLSGGLGADTFAFRVPSGSVTITDFSHAQGDKIDLSALGSDWTAVQAAMAGTTNTVITLGGLTITLDGVTPVGLQASDFEFGTVTVSATDDFSIAASVNISTTWNPLVQFTGASGGTLVNQGSMSLTNGSAPETGVTTANGPDPTATIKNDGSFSVVAWGAVGVAYATTVNTGTFTVTSTAQAYSTYGTTGDVVNSGNMSVQGINVAYGVDNANNSSTGGTFRNLSGGTLSVSSTTSGAYGVVLTSGHDFENAGHITVSAASTGIGLSLGLNTSGSTINNSGVITASGLSTIGVDILQNNGPGAVSFQNSGTITAQTAIRDVFGGPIAITNSGTLNGDVFLWGTSDTVTNTGVINGAVQFNDGAEVLDSHTGTINGTVSLSFDASGTVILGAENNTVVLAGGANHVVDGGGGVNTLSYVNLASNEGVTVSLAAQGKAQNSSYGSTDTLSNFQALVGSAYNDSLEGGGSASTSLTGGLGADTFVYRVGDGAVTVTDFSHVQGDKIDLSSVGAFTSLNDVLAASSQTGSDTVIAIGSGSLRLHNVSMNSLAASDFSFFAPATTVTGASANHFTASFGGAYRQYMVWRDGAAVTGGPDGVSDTLVNIQRLQFVDGYLAVSPTDTAGQVYRIYEATLGRAPDQAGLTNWVTGLNAGASLQSVVSGFVGSQEFQAVYGANLSNSDFVTLLYHNVLGRDPDPAGLNNWISYMAQGHSRADVVLGFSESQEDINNLAAPVQQGLWIAKADASEVARLYDTVFGRLPDAGGLASWTQQLDNGASLASVANGFVGSQEFQSVYGNLNNADFVTLLYHNVLHRDPDPAGLGNWVGQLNSGQSRAQVVIGFSESPEHIGAVALHVDSGVWIAS